MSGKVQTGRTPVKTQRLFLIWSGGHDRIWLLAVTKPSGYSLLVAGRSTDVRERELRLRRWSLIGPWAWRFALLSTRLVGCQGEKSSDGRFFMHAIFRVPSLSLNPQRETGRGSEELRRWSVGSRHTSLSQARLNPHRRSEQTQMYRELV